MSEVFDNLEEQFGFSEYILNESVEGYIYNFLHIYNQDSSSFCKIYFVDKNLKNYFIKIPFYYSLLINSTNLEDMEEYVKTQYSEGFYSSAYIYKFDCTEYNHLNKNKKRFLKICLKYQDTFYKLIKDFKKILSSNKNDKDLESVYKEMFTDKNNSAFDINRSLKNIYEYDIPKEIDIANTLKIKAGCWFQISYNGKDYKILPSNAVVMPDFRIFAFDIETSKKPLKFPDAKFDQIMMISVKTEKSSILIINRDLVSKNINSFEYSPNEEYKSNVQTYNMMCEEDLLLKFVEVFYLHKPHIVTTYNGYYFDFPFIEARMLKYNMVMSELLGFSLKADYYSCRFILHLDCFKWVVRDSYLPIGSQGLKAVTRAKLGYFPDEIDPEEMMEVAKNFPLKMAAYSISDTVATFYIFTKYVQPHILSLCSIIPFSPVNVLCKGSGSLCEALLITEAYNYSLLIPSEKRKEFFNVNDNKVIDNITYVGGYVETLKTGIFRSDFEHNFVIDTNEVKHIANSLDTLLEDFKHEPDFKSVKNDLKVKLLNFKERIRSKGSIYHLDVNAMYPNIILTNRLQPTSIVTNDICVRCDFNKKSKNCQRSVNWEAKIDYFIPTPNEIKAIEDNLMQNYNDKEEQNITNKKIKTNTNESLYKQKYENLSDNKKYTLLRDKILDYSRNIYKKSKNSVIEKRNAFVCQREIPFYVDSVKKFRDKRYLYKKKLKETTALYNECNDKSKKKEIQKEMIIYSSLQVAHKCILNSFYGYVMSKSARWHSTEMAAIVCNIGAQIIKSCKNVLDRFAIPIELDTDGIWVLMPAVFPVGINFKSGNVANLLSLYINFRVCKYFENHQYQEKIDNKYVITPNNSIEFDLDGPYKGMVIPSSLDEGKKLKKRYIVLNWDNSIAEIKGFELKRRGELEIVKRLQEDLLEAYGNGVDLKSCYDSLAKISKYWLDLIDNRGISLTNNVILELFTESKSMSKDIKEYDDKASSILCTAKKMAEVLGNDILSEKLKVEFIVSKYPKDKIVSSRTIPIVAFRSAEANYFIKKWCNIYKPYDIREIIDWEYYKKRVEDIVIKMVCLPAIHQKLKNPLTDIKIPNWTSKLVSTANITDYFKTKKPEQRTVEKAVNNSLEVPSNLYLDYYKKMKNQKGIVKIEGKGEVFVLKMYNEPDKECNAKKTIYFTANKLFFINHRVQFEERFLPNSFEKTKVAFFDSLRSNMTSKIYNDLLVTEIYHDNVPSIFQINYDELHICKKPDYTIITTFNYSKYIIYAISKSNAVTFISKFKHTDIVDVNLKEFIGKFVNRLVILNEYDKNRDELNKLCQAYIICYEKIVVKKTLCTFSELLLKQKNLHIEISECMKSKIALSDYLNFPVANCNLNLLDYLYYKLTVKSGGILSKNSFEIDRTYKNEKNNSGYYEYFTIQFECVGTLILSILEYKDILDNSKFENLNFHEFITLHNLVKTIFIDYSKNILGAKVLLNYLEKWIRCDSNFISCNLKKTINILHQRYIFSVLAHLKELKLKIVSVCSNVFIIVTDKTTKDSAKEVFDNFKYHISQKKGFEHLIIRELRVFDKLIFIDPNNYYYKKNNEFFCISDNEIPNSFIIEFFSNKSFDSQYIYRLITQVDTKIAKTIITILSFRSGMDDLISNCRKLLNINEFSDNKNDIFMLIICSHCNQENNLRTRCIKCLEKYSREEMQNAIKKYFNYYLNKELENETYCNLCCKNSEKKLVEFCNCGGRYVKKTYANEFRLILENVTDSYLQFEYKALLKFYQVEID